MTDPGYTMNTFSVGDYVVFERSYSPADFASFSALSHDSNPLHHDSAYAARSPFGQPIVPLHLTLSPLSMIAGMVFPGEPSLYLGHEVRAAHPVFYDEVLRYSARIEAINSSHRVLTVRVLALRGKSVVLDAKMRVQSHTATWPTPPALPIRNGSIPALALITGAAGEIGSAIAFSLARQGWRLLLQDRGDSNRRHRLAKRLSGIHADATYITADLASQDGREGLAAAIARSDDLGLIVHAASPAISASVEELVAVNFSSLQSMLDAALPGMLARQKAEIVLIGSMATEYAIPGWDTYAGVKSMAATLIDIVDRTYSTYGIRGMTLMPGLVATRFSEEYRSGKPSLLPQEVAEAVLDMIADQVDAGNVVTLEPGKKMRGNRNFRASTAMGAEAPLTRSVGESKSDPGHEPPAPISDLVRRSLNLSGEIDLADAALGITPGWDSLKQIELIVAIEATLGVRFASDEIESAHDFIALDALCRKKMAEKSHE